MTENKKQEYDSLSEAAGALEDWKQRNLGGIAERWKKNLEEKYSRVSEVWDTTKDLLTSAVSSALSGNPSDAIKSIGNAICPGFFGPSTKDLSKNIDELRDGLDGAIKLIGEVEGALTDAINDVKTELQQHMQQQGQKNAEFEKAIQNLSESQNKLKAETQKALKELNQKVDKNSKDIEKNKESIWREQMKLNSLRDEFKDQIKETKVEIKHLQKEQEELAQDQEKFKAKVEERSARTEQAFEDLESDYTRRNKIIDTKIAENEERLDDYAEGLANVEYQQKMMNVQQEEILEELETQNDLIWEQKHKLDFVVNEIEEITDGINQRMSKLQREQLDQEEKIEEALFTANRATRKVEDLAEDLKKHSQKIEKLEEQIERNKQETKQAKKEAERANERIDNLLKNQQLLDNSKEQQTLDKIQKTLELKADEAKLLADLEIISKTQKLITKPAEREWRVGIKEGKEKDIPRPEGFLLKPDSSWAKKFTPEQLREWGWDTRLLGERETAPLTDPEKRKEEQAQPQERQKPQKTEQTEQEKKEKQSEILREIIEETKTNILAQLTEIQQQINENITPLETEIQEASDSSSDSEPETTQNQIEEQEAEIRQQRALAKAQLGRQQRKQQELKQARTQTKSALTKEQNKLAKIEQSLNQETDLVKKQQLQALQKQSEEKITELQEQLEKQEQQFSQQQKKIEETEKTVQEKNKQVEKLQSQKPQVTPQKLEKELQKQEKELNQAQQEVLQHQFEQIKESEEQVLEAAEMPKVEPQKVEEIQEEVKKLEASQVAQKKSMSIYLLYLLIFLIEYAAYKYNGLPGLIFVNVIFAILYYYKEPILEHQDLWEKYFLIVGYVMGNVLAYSAPEQEKYRWPCVIGFNALVLGIYSYTWWQNRKIEERVEVKKAEFEQLTTEYTEEVIQYETERVDTLQEVQENLEKIKQTQLNTTPIATVFAKHNLQDLHQRVSNWRKEEKKEDNIFEMPANLTSATPQVTQLSHLQVFSNAVEQIAQPSEEEEKLLKKLTKLLTANQLLTITFQAPEKQPSLSKFTEPLESKKIKELERELAEITQHSDVGFLKGQIETVSEELKQARETTAFSKYFGSLPNNQKLRLLNLGLNALEINTLEKKDSLIQILSQINQEQQTFDLTIQEKENILRLITSKVSEEQSKVYEEYGIPLYNASNWVITEEQKENLLKIELGKVKVSEEEIKNRKLSVRNQNIVRILASLKRDYKHSLEIRDKIQKLGLKSKHLSYLIQQEIIPDINLAFGEIREPFKQLEKSIIEKEQKKIFKEQQEFEKEETKKRTQEIREKLLPNLLEFAQANREELNNYELPLYHSEKTCWVSVGAIDYYQSIYLNIQGFKSKADYLFFDLLIFAFNGFGSIGKYDANWERWKDISLDFTEELVQEWQSWGFTYKSTKEWIDIGFFVENNVQFCFWLEKKGWTPERVLNETSDNEEKSNEFYKRFDEEKNNLIFLLDEKHLSWSQLLNKHSLISVWEEYLELVKEREAERLEKRAKFLASQQTRNQGQVSSFSANFEALEEKYDRLAGIYEQLRDYINLGQSGQTSTPQPSTSQEQPQQSNSRYDELLSNLSTEEAERQRKKLQRQEAKKKLEEAERKRREDALSEKDRKLKEDEERRQQEKELEAQEAERKKKAQEAREQELKENRQTYLDNQATRIEDAKRRAEEALENERKKMELEKQRREAEIEELKKDTEKELQRIEQEKQLFEQEKEEKLRAIDAEDKEARQRIEKEFEEIKIKLEEKARKKSQENEKELNKRRQELTEKENENKIEIERLKKSADLADQEYQQLKQSRIERTAAQESERQRKKLAEEESRKDRKDKMSLEGIHKRAMQYVLAYFPFETEFSASVQGVSWHTKNGNYLLNVRDWFNEGARINLKGFIGLEDGTAKRVVGNSDRPWVYSHGKELARIAEYVGYGFYNESELRKKIEETMTSPNVFD